MANFCRNWPKLDPKNDPKIPTSLRDQVLPILAQILQNLGQFRPTSAEFGRKSGQNHGGLQGQKVTPPQQRFLEKLLKTDPSTATLFGKKAPKSVLTLILAMAKFGLQNRPKNDPKPDRFSKPVCLDRFSTKTGQN